MTYGTKLIFVVLLLSFFLFGCGKSDNFSYNLFDGYVIKSVANDIKLYKDSELFNINDLDYQIKEFKYNSDVVCLKLDDGSYYMIYYVDGEVYGPHDLESLNIVTNNLSMTFEEDFQDITKARGLIYE